MIEGKTLADLRDLCDPSFSLHEPDELVLHVMVDVVSQGSQSHTESHRHCHL